MPCPRPMVPFTLISALLCRRLPLMSTRTWSAPSPRKVAGRVWSVPSPMVVRGKLSEGASDWRICAVSVRPVWWISSWVSTSTGTGWSIAERSERREPVTEISSSAIAARSKVKFWVVVPPAVTVTVARPVVNPIALTRMSWLPTGRASRYVPSLRVMVTVRLPTTEIRALASAPPVTRSVTLPVTVPVPCATAAAGAADSPSPASAARTTA